MTAWRGVDIVDEARSVQCPALVLHARGDLRVPFDQGRELAATLPDSRFVPLDSSNHLPRVDEPAWEVVLDEVDRFLVDDVRDPTRPPGSPVARVRPPDPT
jgi:pimeloyl-ACP methyl ester carboxylesterase